MKRNIVLILITSFTILFLITGCKKRDHKMLKNDVSKYVNALERTSVYRVGKISEESAKRAISNFIEFYKIYDADIIESRTEEVYSKDVYFRDPFRELEGIEHLKPYLISASEPVEECRFEIELPFRDGHDFYFRWVMYLVLKRDSNKPATETPGMSHIRFNPEGKVIFHMDYWDPSIAVYERIPGLRTFMRFVKKRI